MTFIWSIGSWEQKNLLVGRQREVLDGFSTFLGVLTQRHKSVHSLLQRGFTVGLQEDTHNAMSVRTVLTLEKREESVAQELDLVIIRHILQTSTDRVVRFNRATAGRMWEATSSSVSGCTTWHAGTCRNHGTGLNGVGTVRVGSQHSLSELSLQLLAAKFLRLRQGNVERLALQEVVGHMSDGLAGIIGVLEADETKAALHSGILVDHNLRGDDLTELGEQLFKLLVSHRLGEVFNVQVSVERDLSQLVAALALVHGLSCVQVLLGVKEFGSQFFHFLHVGETLHGAESTFMGLKVHETEALALLHLGTVLASASVGGEPRAGDLGDVLRSLDHELIKLLRRESRVEVLQVHVGEFVASVGSLVARDKRTHENLLAFLAFITHVDELAIEAFHGLLGISGVGELDEAVASGFTSGGVGGDLAGDDFTKVLKDLMEVHVVHSLIQILHEQVAHARLAHSGVTASPADPARASINLLVVQSLKSSLGILFVVEVGVSVSERFICLRVTAHTNGGDAILSNSAEEVVKITLRHVGFQISHMQRSGTRSRSGNIHSGGRHGLSGRSSHFFSFGGFWEGPM